MIETLPWVFSSGWASGINGYAVVLIMGVVGRLGTDDVPAVLQRGDVLIAAAVLFTIDLAADKIPYVDSIWDAVHTAIRPTIGAVLGALLAGDAGTLGQAVAATTGGLTALASHLVKAGIRAGVNTSPEPASNIAVSAAEDVSVASVVSISLLNPWVAATIAAVLLVCGAIVVVLLWRRIRQFRRSLIARRARRRADPDPAPP